MHLSARRAVPATIILPILVLATAGCDIVTADLKHSETAEWRKTYELQPGGTVEIINVNGQILVEPSTGKTVEVVAKKTAKGGSVEDAKRALERIEIVDSSGAAGVRIETKVQRTGGWFGSAANVQYSIRVPSGGQLKFSTVNGGVELRGISGEIQAETTNGGITAREVGGSIDASTTNGGVDIDLTQLGERGARLECTNGGIRLRLPSDAKASISASVSNGGIDVSGLDLDTTESSRQRLEARLNGGGPQIRIEGTNGGIRIGSR
jgi:DUF4097 and DUF4098 domain-containing protein YvlB